MSGFVAILSSLSIITSLTRGPILVILFEDNGVWFVIDCICNLHFLLIWGSYAFVYKWREACSDKRSFLGPCTSPKSLFWLSLLLSESGENLEWTIGHRILSLWSRITFVWRLWPSFTHLHPTLKSLNICMELEHPTRNYCLAMQWQCSKNEENESEWNGEWRRLIILLLRIRLATNMLVGMQAGRGGIGINLHLFSLHRRFIQVKDHRC